MGRAPKLNILKWPKKVFDYFDSSIWFLIYPPVNWWCGKPTICRSFSWGSPVGFPFFMYPRVNLNPFTMQLSIRFLGQWDLMSWQTKTVCLFMIVLPDCQIVCRFGFLVDFQRAYATTMPAETCAEPKMERVRWFSFLQRLNEVWFWYPVLILLLWTSVSPLMPALTHCESPKTMR